MLLIHRLKRTVLQLFLWFAVMLVVMIPLVWFHQKNPNHFDDLHNIISQNTLIFATFRWLIILILFCVWPKFIRRWAKNRYWNPEKTMFWLNQRLKITLWLIVFELIACENLFLTLIRLLEGH